jgi:hypothetical protein
MRNTLCIGQPLSASLLVTAKTSMLVLTAGLLLLTHDLAAQLPDKASELRDRLHRWRVSVEAAMPKPNPLYRP